MQIVKQLCTGTFTFFLRIVLLRFVKIKINHYWLIYESRRENIKMAEMEMNNEQSLIKPEVQNGEDKMENDYYTDFRAQAQDYGQKLQDAAVKAKDYAAEKFNQAGDKLKELQDKNPQQLVEEAKEYARKKPGEAILISAAVGLVLGFLLKRR